MHDIQLHSLKEKERDAFERTLNNTKKIEQSSNKKKYMDIIVVSGIRVMGIIRIDYLANLC